MAATTKNRVFNGRLSRMDGATYRRLSYTMPVNWREELDPLCEEIAEAVYNGPLSGLRDTTRVFVEPIPQSGRPVPVRRGYRRPTRAEAFSITAEVCIPGIVVSGLGDVPLAFADQLRKRAAMLVAAAERVERAGILENLG